MLKTKWWEFRPWFKVPVEVWVGTVVLLFLVQSYQFWWLLETGKDMNGLPIDWTGILAPIYEEVLFRGVILFVLLRKYSVRTAIVLSALLFGLWHFKNIIFLSFSAVLFQQIVYTGFLGVVLAWLTIKTESIWPSVVLHYANNIWAPISWWLFF